MGILQRIFGWEERSQGQVSFDNDLLQALIGTGAVTRDMALQIPTVSGGINLIANIVSGTPIKLYRDNNGKAEEIRDDYRLPLLNDDTGDTLNANEFWHAIILDYYLGKGGYAYICKNGGKIKSLHYVDEQRVSVIKNADPIFKEFQLSVNGSTYNPWNFLRILRNTRDGAAGIPITQENSRLISVSYQQLLLEYSMAKRGGNKKGFLQSGHKIDQSAMDLLREAWKNLYSSDRENVMILNDGIEFKECSDTSAEMQLDENKRTNATEFAKIFHISPEAISGKSEDINSLAKLAAIPLMKCIECALNRDLLLEAEKKQYYFAYDTKELLKGEMRERFEAYKTALDANFMQIDEVRYAEDLEPLGLTWIKLGLQDVLYDPKTKQIYTPNTNQTSAVGPAGSAPEDADEDAPEAAKTAEFLNSDEENGIIESRAKKDKPRYKQNKETGLMEGSLPADGDSSDSSDPSGENVFEVRGFKNKQYLKNHWSNKGGHAEQYKADGILTAEQYEQRALSLIESPTSESILGHCTKSGIVVRYDKEKNDFVKGHPKKGIYTMFKPDDGLKYYKNELRKDIDHGGRS